MSCHHYFTNRNDLVRGAEWRVVSQKDLIFRYDPITLSCLWYVKNTERGIQISPDDVTIAPGIGTGGVAIGEAAEP